MDFETEMIVVATQNELSKLWFLTHLNAGKTREEAAREAHESAREYLRQCGFSAEQLEKYLLPEENFVNQMLVRRQGTDL